MPLAIHNAVASVLDELLKATSIRPRISLAHILDIVDAYSHIERWQCLEVLPYCFVALKCCKNIVVNPKIHIWQHGSTSISHKAQSFESSASLPVEFGPQATLASRRESTPHNALAGFDSGVNPTETQRLLHSIEVLQPVRTLGCRNPYLSLCGVVFNEPISPLFTRSCM